MKSARDEHIEAFLDHLINMMISRMGTQYIGGSRYVHEIERKLAISALRDAISSAPPSPDQMEEE